MVLLAACRFPIPVPMGWRCSSHSPSLSDGLADAIGYLQDRSLVFIHWYFPMFGRADQRSPDTRLLFLFKPSTSTSSFNFLPTSTHNTQHTSTHNTICNLDLPPSLYFYLYSSSQPSTSLVFPSNPSSPRLSSTPCNFPHRAVRWSYATGESPTFTKFLHTFSLAQY